MRVYFVTTKLNFTSAGGSCEEFDVMMKGLQKLGHNVTAITLFSYMNDDNVSKKVTYNVIEERVTARRQLPIQYAIYKVLKKYEKESDIFHVDGHIFLYGAGLYRRLGGRIPVSAYFNRELTSWPENVSSFFGIPRKNIFIKIKQFLRFYIEKYIGIPIANEIDLSLFTSPVLQKKYEEFGFRKDPKTISIGDPIDSVKIMRENGIDEEFYRRRNKKEGPLIIYYSSRMIPGKGFDLILVAFSKVKNKERYKLILGGTGPEEPQILALIKDFNLEKYVTMPGWVTKEQLFQYHKEADIFIQARWRHELTSMALIYAMTFGIPSIIPGGGGLEWIAKQSGIYFKDGDADDLARKIEIVGENYDLRSEMSRKCYERIHEDELNVELIIKHWATEMEKYLKEKAI